MPWNAKFNLRSFRFLGVLWSNILVWEQGAGAATWPDPSPLCLPLGEACMWVCVFTPWAAHSSSFLPGQHSHSAYPEGVRDTREPWRLAGGCLGRGSSPRSLEGGLDGEVGSGMFPKLRGLLASWGRPREKRVRTQCSLNCRGRGRNPHPRFFGTKSIWEAVQMLSVWLFSRESSIKTGPLSRPSRLPFLEFAGVCSLCGPGPGESALLACLLICKRHSFLALTFSGSLKPSLVIYPLVAWISAASRGLSWPLQCSYLNTHVCASTKTHSINSCQARSQHPEPRRLSAGFTSPPKVQENSGLSLVIQATLIPPFKFSSLPVICHKIYSCKTRRLHPLWFMEH